MTVPVPDQLEYITDADGVTKDFSYPKRFLQKDEIVVLLRDANGIDTPQILNAHYTIAGSAWLNGGTISFHNAPLAPNKVVRYRMTQAKQTVDLENDQRNDAPSVETQLDRLTMGLQDRGRLSELAWGGLKQERIERIAGDLALGDRIDQEIIDRINGDEALASLIGQSGDIAEHIFESDTAAALAPIKPTFSTILTLGGNVPGDGNGGVRIASDNGNSAIFTNVLDGRSWYRVQDIAIDRVPPESVSGFASSVAVLQTLDTDHYKTAFLLSAGVEGRFKWTLGDFSDAVTYQPNDYIKANAVAATVGAWVRVYEKLSGDQLADAPVLSFDKYITQLASGDAAALRRALQAAPAQALASRALNYNGDHVVSQVYVDQTVTNIGTGAGQWQWLTDGYQLRVGGVARCSAGRVAIADLPGFDYALKVTVTTAQPTPTGSDEIQLVTHVEGNRFARCQWGNPRARDCVRYVWAKASIAGDYVAYVANSGSTSVVTSPFTIHVPNVWQLVKVQVRASVTGTWLRNKGELGATFGIWLVGGTSPNLAATAGNFFMMTGDFIVAEDDDPGIQDTRDFMRSYEDTVRIAQRYYQKSYNPDVVVGVGSGGGYLGAVSMTADAATNFLTTNVRFTCEMARQPNVVPRSPETGESGVAWNANSSANVSLNISGAGMNGFNANVNNVATSAFQTVTFAWTADARIGY